MNFSQLHERVRIEVVRRIENGSLTATLLAHQIGCTPAHISNFLRQRRKLSIEVLDKVLQALNLNLVEILVEERYQRGSEARQMAGSFDSLPLVEPMIAAASIHIPSGAIIDVIKIRNGILGNLRDKCSAERRRWDRFVAVQVWEEEAALMQPFLSANAIALIDRHYNSAIAYTSGRPSLYAVRIANRLSFRLVSLVEGHLVLRTRKLERAPELIALARGVTTADVIVGRVFLTIVEQ